MPTTKVSIPGIHCEGCAKLIKDVTSDYPLITNVDVDLNTKTVTLEHDPDFDLAMSPCSSTCAGSKRTRAFAAA